MLYFVLVQGAQRMLFTSKVVWDEDQLLVFYQTINNGEMFVTLFYWTQKQSSTEFHEIRYIEWRVKEYLHSQSLLENSHVW